MTTMMTVAWIEAVKHDYATAPRAVETCPCGRVAVKRTPGTTPVCARCLAIEARGADAFTCGVAEPREPAWVRAAEEAGREWARRQDSPMVRAAERRLARLMTRREEGEL